VTWTGAILLAFCIVAIFSQPNPKRRPRSRHRHHHRRRAAAHNVALVTRKQAASATVEPVAIDPTRLDVLSALKNMGYSARHAQAAVQKTVGLTGFEGILKQSLEFLRKPDAKALVG
jgi:hypothetical protein